MARITVEDCITKIPNRFELVVIAAHRAKQIGAGAPLTIDRDNDKNPVVALREIAESTIDPESIRHSLLDLYRQYTQAEPQEEELEDLLAQELAGTRHIADSHAQEVMAEMSKEDFSAELAEDEDDDDVFNDNVDNSEKDSSLYEDADIIDE